MADFSHDLVVIGGGPGGYVAAIRASQCGMRVALIEREALGGICLNWGCIPTKALLRTAELWRGLSELEPFGLQARSLSFAASGIVKRSRSVAKRLNGGVDTLMRKNNVEVCYGEARLASGGSVVVCNSKGKREEKFSAEHIIVASGARAREVRGLEIDGGVIWGYREAMLAERFPKNLLIVGGGAIGIEFACYFAAFGVEVTIVEAMARILPNEDEEIAEMLRVALAKRGIKFQLGVPIKKASKKKNRCEITLEDGSKMAAEKLLSAIGVVGNVERLGLEEIGVEFDKGSGVIKVDAYGQTNKQGIYAIGDVAGAPMLAHKASHEGIVCVEAIAAQGNRENKENYQPNHINKAHIPACVYSSPQVASVGLSEKMAMEVGRYKVRVGRFPLLANGKAIAIGETEGMVKVVFDEENGGFLGAQMIGAEVTEMVQGFALALTMEATEQELMRTIFPHPTISETMQEAVLAAYHRPIHIPPAQ